MGSLEAAPSDTQVVSQSVFDNIIQQNNDGNNDTLRTLHEGESGHVDLLAGFGATQLDAINTEDNEDQDPGDESPSSPLDYQPNLFPESQRFIATPATAVKSTRVDNRSNESPSVSWNPLASEAKSNGGTMALSQMFEATQAPSSPLVNRQQSDNLSDRPSPNLPIQHYPLAAALSSPSSKLAATFPQDSSEPNMNYITMKESQAEREKIRMTRSAENLYSEDQSDDEFSKEPSFVERMKRRRMINEESSAQFAGLSAPARPSSNRASRSSEKLRTSSPGEQEKQDRAGASGAQVLGDGRQQADMIPQDGAISEDETEQEDELDRPVPRSQPNSSTEEDKENYNDTPAPPLAAAASAHGRLSQALALEGSPSPIPAGESMSRQKSHSPNPDEQVDGVARSSQIYIVKDSQQSPARDGNRDNEGRQENHNPQKTLSQQQEAPSEAEKATPSPVLNPTMQSSPPPSMPQGNSPFSLSNGNHTAKRARSASASSDEFSNQLPKTSSAPDGIRTQSSNPASQVLVANGEKTKSDLREKSSSMPSRVAETPVSQQPKFDVVPATTIPETSPNRQGWNSDTNGDAIAQEDDDLPPVYPAGHDRASQSRPSGPPTSSTVKTCFNSKILSSPSGRQRRALTEIASEASPGGPGNLDLDIGILTADDREFRSMVAMSPNPPRKKRRGNDGQNIYASDPVLPVTPRPSTPRFPQVRVQETIPEEPQLELPREEEDSNTAFRRRSRPSKRAETVWDVDASPQRPPPRLGRSRKSDLSRSRDRQSAQTQEPEKDMSAPPAAVEARLGPGPGQNIDFSVQEPKTTTSEEEPGIAKPLPGGGVQIACNQVLAPWSGQKRAYYPATCFGTPICTSTSRYVVKFEDSLPIEVPITGVKRLELRIGDGVKLEIPNVPRVTHIIRGFDDKISEEDLCNAAESGLIPMTDVYGHLSVILGPKQRKSLPNGGLPGPESVIKVPISRIYLDTILWNQLKDRNFNYNAGAGAKKPESRLQTPPDRHSTLTPPSSRVSRSIRYMGGLFAGMIFAVSYVDDDEGKSRITRLLLENDGRIIDGFSELFDFSSNVPIASPTKSQAADSGDNNSVLRPTSSAEDVGFACVIADKHSRREKYMQALALNLPCLSGRWVEDCIAQNRIVDWEMYLLPAGDSMYLNGAAKSRILQPSPATNARFSHTIAGRPNLLQGQSVLIVMGRGKEEEKSRAYIFLTHALGASRVERVYDLSAAKTILNQESEAGLGCSWDWVYVHGCDQDAVRAAFLGSAAVGPQSGRGTKRRKMSHFMGCISGQDLGLSPKLTVVGNDFVCQSLILGKLFEA